MNNYFSHDSNARNSDKILPLRMSLSAEGYGIYFMILERLREEPDYMSIKDYNMLAFDFRVGTDKVKSVIENFGLFSFTDDGKRFYSESFTRRMDKKDEKSVKARESAIIRWEKEKDKCERNANASKNDAIKEKERKGKNSNKKEVDFLSKIITAFQYSYFEIFGISYVVMSVGKERAAASKLVEEYKKKYPDAKTEQVIAGLSDYFKQCCRVPDEWLRKNMSLPIIVSKFNEINNHINNAKDKRNNKSGDNLEAIINAVYDAKGLG